MISITILSIIQVLVLLLIRVAILYFLIKVFDKKVNLSTVFKLILSYELIAFFIFLFYSNSLKGKIMYQYGGNLPLLLSIFLISCVILFLIFSFLLKKFILLNWKKAIIIFIVINLTIPLIDSFLIKTVYLQIYEMPIFEKEIQEMEWKDALLEFFYFPKKHPILNIIGKIHNSLLGIGQYFIPIES